MPKIYEQAVQLLAQREHSAFELAQKLCAKGHERDEVESAIVLCQERGYQSDARYAEQFCRYRAGRGDGPIKIKHALQQKQISSDLIEAQLDSIDWYAQVVCVYQKKYGDNETKIDFKTRQKQMRFMQSRGFDTELIRVCFSDF